MPRTFVIGDIHGADKALSQLIERVAPEKSDTLIFLGDYVDGWSGSAAVITRLLALKESFSCIFIKGNHDVWCGDWLAGKNADEEWLKHGGASTVQSYAALTENEKDLHRTFFTELIDYYIDEHNNLFIHAGFSSMHGPAKEPYATNCTWDRTLWETALALNTALPPDHAFFPKRLKLFREIFIGHTPTTNYGTDLPIHAANIWNVDTGAAFTGKITAIDLDSKVFFQSDKVIDLYPGEKGRNI